MFIVMNSYHLITLVFACKDLGSSSPRTSEYKLLQSVCYFPKCRFVLLCSPMSPPGSGHNSCRPPSVVQRCSAFLNGSVLVQVGCPWLGNVFAFLARTVLSQNIGSFKPRYPAGSWEARAFPAEWGEARDPSLATSPVQWQNVVKHRASGRKTSFTKASVIRLQKS